MTTVSLSRFSEFVHEACKNANDFCSNKPPNIAMKQKNGNLFTFFLFCVLSFFRYTIISLSTICRIPYRPEPCAHPNTYPTTRPLTSEYRGIAVQFSPAAVQTSTLKPHKHQRVSNGLDFQRKKKQKIYINKKKEKKKLYVYVQHYDYIRLFIVYILAQAPNE